MYDERRADGKDECMMALLLQKSIDDFAYSCEHCAG